MSKHDSPPSSTGVRLSPMPACCKVITTNKASACRTCVHIHAHVHTQLKLQIARDIQSLACAYVQTSVLLVEFYVYIKSSVWEKQHTKYIHKYEGMLTWFLFQSI